MSNYKVIFTGPVGVGKTTAISALSDIPVISTEARASDYVVLQKATTTVAMDYGLMKLNDKERIHFYGTPGQERFNFMWEILREGGIGLILLLDNSREATFEDLHFFLDKFRDFIEKTKVVIGVTKMDLCEMPTLEDYYKQLAHLPIKPPIFEVDARNRADTIILVQALLYAIDPGLSDSTEFNSH